MGITHVMEVNADDLTILWNNRFEILAILSFVYHGKIAHISSSGKVPRKHPPLIIDLQLSII